MLKIWGMYGTFLFYRAQSYDFFSIFAQYFSLNNIKYFFYE
ncbi:hypothetical protein HMPREF0663_12205 [Hoylesella oralis ATCC 33269]|uniref:Uncharacterized protein n=1 Tax=Hoylesella oralis ATCC 33269 TaxID=873533 RepID=E7RSD7_9BACT|nr:hypothetical protein HMPREF0663_12205 [Hoylesella oralis ATCC 33269]